MLPQKPGPIGVFDSGYGGLTILKEIKKILPDYDYLYLGDNARTPYGTRSFEIVYKFTLQAVERLFKEGCHLVILACNTASAKALRSIQVHDLPSLDVNRRVLGVIRPTVERLNQITNSKHIGVLATPGTVFSQSYPLEIAKLFPEIQVASEACPMWVPLVEYDEANKKGADYFVKQHIINILNQDQLIDTLILGCTHYPLLLPKIKQHTPNHIHIISQGEYVANSLKEYLTRHPQVEAKCTKGGSSNYYTTESTKKFIESASIFLNEKITVKQITLD
ncbi:MAG: glutamate racemase [Bacteroidales bacterium]|nr:glutamate racemase [Bacteroidales bacterium]